MADINDLRARSAARLAAIPARKPAATFYSHPGYASAGPATSAARNAAGPGCSTGGLARKDGKFVPVVVLRLDQRWMRERIEERGVVVFDDAQVSEIIAKAGL